MNDDSTLTDWNACYRAGETPWEKGAAAPPLLEWLARPGHHRLAGDGKVLVPGCGFGHDVRAIAAARPSADVLGLDIAPAAIERARSFPKVDNESYLLADLFALPAAWRGRFDWVFEHTCFCAIAPAQRPAYVAAVTQALRPGGQLLAIFYLDPWDRGEPRPPGGGPPFEVTVEKLDTLFAAHFRLVEEHRPTRAYPGREGRELLRLLERKMTNDE